MATYLSGSSVKGDTMQTLYLMNPSYTAYNDSSNSGNMVLLSPTTGLANQDLLGNPGQQQQQYAGFSLPQTVPQQTHATAIANTNMGHHASPQEIFANRLSSQGYNWNGGNELLFLPASDMRGDGQSLSARFNSINTGQNPTSGVVSHLDTRSLSQPSFQEQVPFIPSGVALGLSAESLQTSTGAGQILSLSLSPQQPALNQLQSFPIQHPELAVNSGAGLNDGVLDNYSNKGNQWMGNTLSSLRASPSMLGTGYQGQVTGVPNNRQVNVLSGSPKVELYASKYLKPAQQLLNEVVSVGRGSKNSSVNQAKQQSWGTPSTFGGGFGQEKNLAETGGKDGGAVANWGNEKDRVLSVSALPMAVSEVQEHNVENLVELTATDRQELQIKKAKLLAMVDEVDQRYRQYHHQMQIVVASFETTAGLGAARTYTALALQTISKHFRCLKDAIKGQIRVACKVLGEEFDMGHGRGETSRLRFIDQQLRQQRALQQLGMMQQHPWRPQRGLPERSVSVLRAWLFEHFLHPYPKDSDKVLLARQTGLTRNQVSNWFINARVRLWKPMVEEMYAEEVKDEEFIEGSDKPSRDQGDDGSKGPGVQDAAGKNESSRSLKQGNSSDFKTEGFLEAREAVDRDNSVIQSKILTTSLSDSLMLQERESSGQGVKRVRSDLSTNLDMKSYDLHSGHLLTKGRTEDTFGIPSEGLVQDDDQNLGSYGMYQLGGFNRFSNQGLGATYPNSTAVSLTLGLQRSEGLSVSGAQQNYMHGQGPLHIERRQEGEMNPVNFYSMHDISGGHPGSYEVMNLQDRKRFASHMLQHDFT
ncbi:hypothetical protein GOP47_0029490 [Adiantum capillus-veneris]|nr:hypothetical protein GOP47_0029490 [Adiantum capillus-veneris]